MEPPARFVEFVPVPTGRCIGETHDRKRAGHANALHEARAAFHVQCRAVSRDLGAAPEDRAKSPQPRGSCAST